MQTLSQKLDRLLLNIAWSLWTELGVSGVKRQHQHCLIVLEELVILTAILADVDARLRDEALDWCARYHHFISISRLKTLLKTFGPSVDLPFSIFAATLNSISQANWPLLSKVMPLKFSPSGKSKAPRCELPALLSLRFRALFGAGARADLMTYFLTEEKNDFTAADVTEIGYSKRSLSLLLDSFVQSGFFEAFNVRNQRHYRFIKRDQMKKELGPIPDCIPSWRYILEVVLPLRQWIAKVENKALGVKVIEIRNVLIELKIPLQKLNWKPPQLPSDINLYWELFSVWIESFLSQMEHPES